MQGEVIMNESSYFWEDLLQFIEEQSVIPIIGHELLLTEINGETVPLYQYLAEELADLLSVPRSQLSPPFTLNDVACRYLQMPGTRREDMYRRMGTLIKSGAFSIPETLRKLASIRSFTLYVSTTFDPLLETAINEVRFRGAPRTQSVTYTFKESKDLPCEIRQLPEPMVFYLCGRATSQPNYVVTQEDTLEFMHSLQSEKKRPRLLFDALRSHHLLLLGSTYPDWLARFFIRAVRNERLMMPCDQETILVSDTICKDEHLVPFLSSPLSYGTRVLESCGTAEFVDELHSRWCDLNPAREPEPDIRAEIETPGPEMSSGAVFLSYASEDIEIVERVKAQLEHAGLDVWFDKRRLEAGDEYDLKIRRNIRECATFCPFISKNTEARLEGYFRREWSYAVDRTLDLDESVPFVLPIVIHDVDEYAGRVPEKFKSVQWTRLVDGSLPDDFLQRMTGIVREHRRRTRGY